MKMKSFLFLLFAAIIMMSFACQQKKNAGQSPQTLNDTTPVSPIGMAPGVSDKTGEPARTDTVPRAKLAISRMQAQVLDTGTVIGRPGDLLLTFTGRGFVFTDKNPVVEAGGMKFEETYINEDGTEFFAVIPADGKTRLTAAARGGLQVINPGDESVTFKEQTEEIMKRADADKKVKLVYTKFGVARVEEK